MPPGTIPRLLKYPATAYGVDYGGVCVCVCWMCRGREMGVCVGCEEGGDGGVLDVKREGGGRVLDVKREYVLTSK